LGAIRFMLPATGSTMTQAMVAVLGEGVFEPGASL
jgi:hypothetical protein